MQIVPSHRASDSDREQVAERLRHATGEGRLTGDELAQRLESLYAARTYGELDALVVDLPADRAPERRHIRRGPLVAAAGAVTLVLMVLGMLAVVTRRASVVVSGTGGPRRLVLPGPIADPRPGLMIAASLAAVVVVLLTSAALLWALMDSRARRGKP